MNNIIDYELTSMCPHCGRYTKTYSLDIEVMCYECWIDEIKRNPKFMFETLCENGIII